MKQQRLAEEGDRELFKDLVGGVESNLAAGAIDNMVPETREEFEDFGKKVAEKFASLEGSDHFQDFAANFIEILCRDHLQVATLKKVKQSADAFHSAKLKEEKAKGKTAAGKKPEKKATLKMKQITNPPHDVEWLQHCHTFAIWIKNLTPSSRERV